MENYEEFSLDREISSDNEPYCNLIWIVMITAWNIELPILAFLAFGSKMHQLIKVTR